MRKREEVREKKDKRKSKPHTYVCVREREIKVSWFMKRVEAKSKLNLHEVGERRKVYF